MCHSECLPAFGVKRRIPEEAFPLTRAAPRDTYDVSHRRFFVVLQLKGEGHDGHEEEYPWIGCKELLSGC